MVLTCVQQHAMQLVLRLSSAQLASMMLCALIHDFGFVKEHVQVRTCTMDVRPTPVELLGYLYASTQSAAL